MNDSTGEAPRELNSVYYGRALSRTWDRDFGTRPDTDDAVDFVARMAEGRRVLEFGVGTGRIALPLARRGIDVSGIEYSPWMAEELRAKEGGFRVQVHVGDFTELRVPGDFGLVLLPSYTLFGLATQDDQVRCFENASNHLEPGGLFVLELSPTHGPIYENGRAPMSLGPGWFEPAGSEQSVWILLKQVDQESQLVRSNRISIRDGVTPQVRPFAGRFACPGEVDLMARLSGLRQFDRWSDWAGRSYSPDSLSYVVAYEKPRK